MNDPRQPAEFAFTDRQADLMRRTYAKVQGHIIRGKTNIATGVELVQAGLITLSEVEKGPPGQVVRFTSKGREAWYNFCLKAAGRKPVCLM